MNKRRVNITHKDTNCYLTAHQPSTNLPPAPPNPSAALELVNAVSFALRDSGTKYNEKKGGEPFDMIFASDCDLWCVGTPNPFCALLLAAFIAVRAADGGDLGADWFAAPPESTASDGNRLRVDDDNKTWFAPFVRYVCKYGRLSVPSNIPNVGIRNAGQDEDGAAAAGNVNGETAAGSSAFVFPFFLFPPFPSRFFLIPPRLTRFFLFTFPKVELK